MILQALVNYILGPPTVEGEKIITCGILSMGLHLHINETQFPQLPPYLLERESAHFPAQARKLVVEWVPRGTVLLPPFGLVRPAQLRSTRH